MRDLRCTTRQICGHRGSNIRRYFAFRTIGTAKIAPLNNVILGWASAPKQRRRRAQAHEAKHRVEDGYAVV